jgi:hypothetical protein
MVCRLELLLLLLILSFCQYDHAHCKVEEKAVQEELSMAHAHRKTLASEVQTVHNQVAEGEHLLQSLKTEAQAVELWIQEADEHIGFMLKFIQRQKLYWLTQHPVTTHTLVDTSSSSPINSPSPDGATASDYSEPDQQDNETQLDSNLKTWDTLTETSVTLVEPRILALQGGGPVSVEGVYVEGG